MKPLISIIVPVYGVEKYLLRCIDSILAQTYKNLEIILVDDGSPDRCPQICDEYAQKDSRIKVIHKSNGGLSDARNFGLDIASGAYIGFVDSDDYILPDMYEYLYNGLLLAHADISVCGVKDEYIDVQPEPFSDFFYIQQETFLDKKNAVEKILNDTVIVSHVWDKLFKASVLQKLRFPIGRRFEDMFFTHLAINNAQSVILLPHKKYVYVHRSASISYTHQTLNCYHIFLAYLDRLYFACAQYPNMVEVMLNKATTAGVDLYNSLLKCDPPEEIDKNAVVVFLQKYGRQIRTAKSIPMKYKVFAYSIVHFSQLHRRFYLCFSKLLTLMRAIYK